MKKIFLAMLFVGILSCKNQTKEPIEFPEQSSIESQIVLGKEIFEDRGNCFSCHLPDKKRIGPSLQEIAKIYKDQNGDIVSFLKGEAAPIVDPSQYEVMKTNFPITEEMSDEELQALEAYVYSNLE